MKYTDSNEWKLYIELTNKRPDLFIQSEDLLIITDPDTVNEYVADSGRKLGVFIKVHGIQCLLIWLKIKMEICFLTTD